MSEGKCDFCKSNFWLEHIKICKDCFEKFHNIHNSEFVLICKTKGMGISYMTINEFYDVLDEAILPHFQRKLKKHLLSITKKGVKKK